MATQSVFDQLASAIESYASAEVCEVPLSSFIEQYLTTAGLTIIRGLPTPPPVVVQAKPPSSHPVSVLYARVKADPTLMAEWQKALLLLAPEFNKVGERKNTSLWNMFSMFKGILPTIPVDGSLIPRPKSK